MINIVEAEHILDKDLSKAQTEMLLAAREGIAFKDADGRTFEALLDKGLVEVIPFSHPRAKNSINGVVPTEDGVKILNVIDNRHWAAPDTPLSSEAPQTDDRELIEDSQNVPKGVEAQDDVEYTVAVDDDPSGEVAKNADKHGKLKK